MDLISAELRSAFTKYPIGSQDGKGDTATVIAKFFFSAGRYTFFATEGEEQCNDVFFFGFCISPFGPDCDEWGYTSLSELESVNVRGLRIERDTSVHVGAFTVAQLRHRAA